MNNQKQEWIDVFELCKNPQVAHEVMLKDRAAKLTWDADFPIPKRDVSAWRKLARDHRVEWEKESISKVLLGFLHFVKTYYKEEFYEPQSHYFHNWSDDPENDGLEEAGFKTYEEQWRWLVCASRMGLISPAFQRRKDGSAYTGDKLLRGYYNGKSVKGACMEACLATSIYDCYQTEREDCWFKAISVPEMLKRFIPIKSVTEPKEKKRKATTSADDTPAADAAADDTPATKRKRSLQA